MSHGSFQEILVIVDPYMLSILHALQSQPNSTIYVKYKVSPGAKLTSSKKASALR